MWKTLNFFRKFQEDCNHCKIKNKRIKMGRGIITSTCAGKTINIHPPNVLNTKQMFASERILKYIIILSIGFLTPCVQFVPLFRVVNMFATHF